MSDTLRHRVRSLFDRLTEVQSRCRERLSLAKESHQRSILQSFVRALVSDEPDIVVNKKQIDQVLSRVNATRRELALIFPRFVPSYANTSLSTHDFVGDEDEDDDTNAGRGTYCRTVFVTLSVLTARSAPPLEADSLTVPCKR